jgi:hypothetical protein
MKTLKLLLCLSLIAGCKKEKAQMGKATFYNIGNTVPTLYVDGKKIGRLTISAETPACGENINEQIRSIELSYGEHRYSFADRNDSQRVFTINSPCRLLEIEP